MQLPFVFMPFPAAKREPQASPFAGENDANPHTI
jgi:hypothetical protein